MLRPYGRRRAAWDVMGVLLMLLHAAASVGWYGEENAQILHHAQCMRHEAGFRTAAERAEAQVPRLLPRSLLPPPAEAAILAQPTNDLFLCGLVPLLCADDEQQPPALDNHTSVWAGTAVGLQRRLPCLRTAPPLATLDHLKAQGAPKHPGAPPQQLGGSPWPQEPASGRGKLELLFPR